MQKVLITGGSGYCGSALVPQLLDEGWAVTVYDIMYYGCDFLPSHPNLSLVEGNIRDIEKLTQTITGHDAVLHLACISNDASFELDERRLHRRHL